MTPSSLCRRLLLSLLPLFRVLLQCAQAASVRDGDHGAFFTDRWAVEVRGGEHVARRLAADHGFEFVAKVRSFVSLTLPAAPVRTL